MRVLMVLTALVAAPFIAGVAQGRSDNHGRKDVRVVRHDERPKAPTAARARSNDQDCDQHGQHEGKDEGCGAPTAVLGSISGTVFFDMSYDGLWDVASEAGIPDWSVMLSGAATASVLTDASGKYLFPNLAPGTYQVCETQRYAWLQTAPTGAGCASGFGYTIVLTSGQALTGQDFGNVR